jgi:hypothetical protein
MTDTEFADKIRFLLTANENFIINPVCTEQANVILYQYLLSSIINHGRVWLKYFTYGGNA